MRLNNRADYALRALIRLALTPSEFVPTREVAGGLRISYNHLNKIVTDLAKAGFVEIRRGRNGGVRLARQPAEIRVGAVLRKLERLEIVECFDAESDTCVISPVCGLKPMLEGAAESFLAALDGYTLADVLHRRQAALRRTLQA